jgi:hypothetical protein
MLQIGREFAKQENEDIKVSREWAHAGPDGKMQLCFYQKSTNLLKFMIIKCYA